MNDGIIEIIDEKQEFFAKVEVVGRRTYYGKVRQASLGGGALLMITTPHVPEMTRRESGYFSSEGGLPGHGIYEVTRGPVPSSTLFVGIGSIYMLTPITEEACIDAVSRNNKGEYIKAVRIEAPVGALPAAQCDDDDQDDDDQDDDDQGDEPF